MADEPQLKPVMSTCMYCATDDHNQCVPLVRGPGGEVQMVCACNQSEHGGKCS